MRQDLLCPACGTPAPPLLMPPPTDYFCENCKLTLPRSKLRESKYNRLALAGSNLLPFPTLTLMATGTMVDLTQATTSISSASFTASKSKYYVVAIGVSAVAAASGAVSTVSFDGLVTSLTRVKDTNAANGVDASLWLYSPNPSSLDGATVMTASFTGTPNPAGAAIAVYELKGGATSPTDKTAGQAGSALGNVSSGATATLTQVGELAVCATAWDDLTLSFVYSQGFSLLTQVSANASTSGADCGLAIGIRNLSSTQALVSAKGTISGAGTDYGCVVATFSHA